MTACSARGRILSSSTKPTRWRLAGDKKTLAYQLGEKLSEMTDHFLLMTATPHKGDPESFRPFLPAKQHELV